ncbi:ACR096Wp [Eremothecium gossypii ATCC 10895]|uniref:ACR096Wp n=1 Tax=Eremothecium gossypii (strain ATCC 10895 / CBS 109.51 / FGSC 9923 / NRRL Y-1056) TaxID=284811 RepID=Q75C21_EREGS|nr:ACR096Wp [Eremothecium gossypii ATCC 10895]AAS51322.1 ACR096Wp [Eremothecium gossypii ATCC 10895]
MALGIPYLHEYDEDTLKQRLEAVLPGLPYATQLTLKSLPLLNDISTQLLRLLTITPLHVLTGSVQEDKAAQAEHELFHVLVDALIEVKEVYGDTSLLTVYDVAPGIWFPGCDPPLILRNFEQFVLATIRKCNLVMFMLTLLGKFQYGFQFLNECFIDIFCPSNSYSTSDGGKDTGSYSVQSNASFTPCTSTFSGSLTSAIGGRLLKTHTVLYLNMKTQAFIAAMEQEDPLLNRKQILDTLFPADMATYLQLKSGEPANEFQLTPSEKDFITRCQRRRETLEANTDLRDIMELYKWSDFLKEFLAYVSKNVSLLVFGKRAKCAAPKQFELSDSLGYAPIQNARLSSAVHPSDSSITPAAVNTPIASASPNEVDQRTDGVKAPNGVSSCSVPSGHLNEPIIARKKLQQKRMWVKEEEEALISALKVYGPAWSKILEYHGAGGSVSETLKNRTQVQLKDKARNWKMHYLKKGAPVPFYLLKVTGNLEREEKFKKRSKAKRKSKGSPSQ